MKGLIKKIGVIVLMLILFAIASTGSNKSSAATGSKYFNIIFQRDTGYTYQAIKDNFRIFKVVEYDSTGTTANKDTTAYCIKGGPGFGSTEMANGESRLSHYTQYFDMKKPDEIPSTYKAGLPSDTTKYKALVWLLENIYVKPAATATAAEKQLAQEVRTKLLEDAGIDSGSLLFGATNDAGNKMTESEIIDVFEVVQQAAIWHFTNTDQYYANFLTVYRNRTAGIDSNYKLLGDDYIYEDDYIDDEVADLFEYLINTATAKGNDPSYVLESASGDPIELKSTPTPTMVASGSDYIVGPFKIEEKLSGVDYSIESIVSDQNGSNINSKVSILDASKNEVTGSDINAKVKSQIGNNFYIKVSKTGITSVRFKVNSSYISSTVNAWFVANAPATEQPLAIPEKSKHNYSKELTVYPTVVYEFDLALRKFITKINDIAPEVSREPVITQSDLEKLKNGEITTVPKTHPKDPLLVKKGDIVLYTIRIYNEGTKYGYAKEVTDYLPDGLEFVDGSSINETYGWTVDGTGKIIKTDYLKDRSLSGFNPEATPYSLDYADILIECRVTADIKSNDQTLKNVAEITEDAGPEGEPIDDRDSTPESLTPGDIDDYGKVSKEDDDDYEDLILPGQYFDVSLRKFITNINGSDLKGSDGKYLREPIVDVTKLKSGESTTAEYNHPKKPVSVSEGDIVIYTIRVYNEGTIDGYVKEITDHLPPQLEFVNDEFNAQYGWILDSNDPTQRTIRTDYLSKTKDPDNLLKAYDGGDKLDYKDVQVKCKVKNDINMDKKITNIAEITDRTNSNNEPIEDRDNSKVVVLPSDEDLPNYKDDEIESGKTYIPGQEDDDDFEKLILEKFDLALRKFITGVNEEAITNREPQVDKSKFGTTDSNGKVITDLIYNHTKDPVRVEQNDIVIYTIRVYNEGTKAGYAAEVKDDVPDGLLFLPDNTLNKEYRWKMYDDNGNETTDASKAKYIRSDYLSKEQESTPGENLLAPFDVSTMDTPDYRDVRVAFKVTEPNTSDRIITNKAEISKDTDEDGNDVTDIDSTPDEWNEGEDDQDVEHIYVKYFDLALRKWVSHVIIIEDGKETIRNTGHTPDMDPEPVVKVELNNTKLDNIIVKFKYGIRITNEGEIAGYATEITDYIPEGLKFEQADNPKWTEKEDGIVVTDQLKDTLLQPGESAIVEITLTWIKRKDNLGLKVNTAEISADKNDSNTPDIDSTPNNKVPGEDDIDDAPVILSVKTGGEATYVGITSGVLSILGIGVFLIKKFVI